MGHGDYEVDEHGKLIEREGGATQAEAGEGDAPPPVTPAARKRFLSALLASDVIGIAVLIGGAMLFPESRTILLILGVAYALVSVPIYVWMSRSTQRKVEESPGRYPTS
jgi:hypothetical protein